MRRKIFPPRLAGAVLLMAALLGEPAAVRAAPVFDDPTKIVTIPAAGDQDAITCTFYGDIMIRISGTDTPAPDDALLLQHPAGISCATKPSHGITLPTSGYSLSGRKGDFLVFEATDPSGASALIIFDARTGRNLFADGDSAITSVDVTQGTLRLGYIRAFNGTCSLLANPDGCWSALLAGEKIPRGVFAGPPAREVCVQSYRPAGSPAVPDDDPSMVSYPVLLVLDSAGHARVRVVGPLGCDPMP